MRGPIRTVNQCSNVLLGALMMLGLLLITAEAQASQLTFNGEYRQGVGGVAGLDGIVTVAQSPDGKQVYVSALGANGGLTTFDRDQSTGKLLFNQTAKIASYDLVNLAFSADAKHLYATTLLDKLVVLERDTNTGKLSLKTTISDVPGLVNTFLVTVSTDGKHVYVLSRHSSGSDVLAAFARDANSGELSSIAQYFDNVGDVRGLAKASAMVISPDGKSVYVTSSVANSITLFNRDAATGAVTFAEQLSHATPGVAGLLGASDAQISADGKQVYVTSAGDNALVAFNRDVVTGRLSLADVHDSGKNPALVGAQSIGLGHDGAYIFVAATLSDAISVYKRDMQTAKLTLIEALVANAELGGLMGVDSLSVSADGSSLYVAPLAGAVITAFQVSKAPASVDATSGTGETDRSDQKANPALISAESSKGGGGAIDEMAFLVLLCVASVRRRLTRRIL